METSALQFKRILSPSAINLYFQCPRRFYYKYIEELPEQPTIHTIRGNVVHDTLEKIYDLDVALLKGDYRKVIEQQLHALHFEEWNKAMPKLQTLGLDVETLQLYFTDSTIQLSLWLIEFMRLLEKKKEKLGSVEKAWEALKPAHREIELHSQLHGVRGFLDMVWEEGERIHIIDYKTGAKAKISEEYQLQMTIYHLLYKEQFGKEPETFLWFLKHGKKEVAVNEAVLEDAKAKIRLVHAAMQSEEKEDYAQKKGPLCKWNNGRTSGQCDFYEQCFGK